MPIEDFGHDPWGWEEEDPLENEYLLSNLANVVAERPDFGPRQVRSPEELEEGRTYIKHYLGHSVRIIFTRFSNDREWIWVTNCEEPVVSTEISLADAGVIPYQGDQGDRWNPTNWLEKTDS